MDLPRITEHDTVGRDVKIDEGVRRDHNVVAYGDPADYGRVDPDGNTVSDFRTSCALAGHNIAYGTALVQVYVVAYDDVHSYYRAR